MSEKVNTTHVRSGTEACTVSVCIFTYQHRAYIAQCIESAVNQKTGFVTEILIGEDGSTDGTAEICDEYAARYPDLIRVFHRDRKDVIYINGHATGRFNFAETMKSARGEFLALLDGDDYWCDEHKLQKQVDQLRKNPDCVASHHWQRVANRNADGTFSEAEAPKEGQGFYPAAKATVQEIFENKVRLKSRTLLFRNILKEGIPLPAWFYEVRFGDVPLTMILGKYGNFAFLNEEMAVYRMTGTGVSRKGAQNPWFFLNHQLEWIAVWEKGDRYFEGKYAALASATILYFYRTGLEKYSFSAKSVLKCSTYALFGSNASLSRRLALFFRLIRSYFGKRLT